MAVTDDTVAMQLSMRGIPPTAENYKRMADALRMGGWQGGASPVTPRMADQARSYMPQREAQSNSLDRLMSELFGDDEQDNADTISGSESTDTTAPMRSDLPWLQQDETSDYLDSIAGKKTAATAQRAKPRVSKTGESQNADGSYNYDPALDTESPIAPLPTVDNVTGQQPTAGAQPDTGFTLLDLLATLTGAGAGAYGAKKAMTLSRVSGRGTADKPITAPAEQPVVTEKPRVRVKAGSRKEAAVTVSLQEERKQPPRKLRGG